MRQSVKRWIAAILLSLAGWVGAYASTNNFDLISLAAQTASGNGATIDVSGYRQLEVTLHITTGSGTLSVFAVYVEASDDGGTTWYELPFDWMAQTTGADADVTATLNKRNLFRSTSIQTSDVKVVAAYTVFGSKVRARWIITPTSSPSETFSVKAVGKN